VGGYKSLPFATYDLAVYLPGGAVLLVLAQYTLETMLGTPFLPEVSHFGSELVDGIILAVLWLSASYLLGHLGAYLSSLIIEKFVHNVLSYPSSVWLRKEQYVLEGIPSGQFLKNFFREKAKESFEKHRGRVTSWFAFGFFFPVWIPFAIFFWLRPVGFYDPKLPDGLLGDVRREFKKVSNSVLVEEGTRWEKMVEHYVANNCPEAYQRMYNYLVIYGALRLLAFILIVASWIILAKSATALLSSSGFEFSLRRGTIFIGTSIAGYFAILAFAKFNRRFFEECVLALLLAGKTPSGPRTIKKPYRSWGAGQA